MNRYEMLLNKKPLEPLAEENKVEDTRWYKNHRIYEYKDLPVLKEHFPRANKEHHCHKCGAMILKGHFYKTFTLGSKNKYPLRAGAYESFKLCLSCAARLQLDGKLL